MPIASSSRGHSHHKLGFWDLGPVLTMHPLLGDPAAPGAAASLVTKPHAEPTAQSTSEPQPCGHLPVAAPGPPPGHTWGAQSQLCSQGRLPPKAWHLECPASLRAAGPQFLGRPCWFTPILAEGLGRGGPEMSELRTVERLDVLMLPPHSRGAFMGTNSPWKTLSSRTWMTLSPLTLAVSA